MKRGVFLSLMMYLVSFLLVGYYFSLEFNKNINMSPSARVILLLTSSIIMYIGSILLSRNINKKYQNLPFKINIIIWLFLYIALLFTLTLFDDYFHRGGFKTINLNIDIFKNYINSSFNIVPFKTIIFYIRGYINGNIKTYVFIYNVLGNIIALMPLAFFLPIVFKRQEKFRNFFITSLIIVITIELLQFITLSGSCDIDDVIFNVLGAITMFKILEINKINKFVKKIFFLENKTWWNEIYIL